jgi:hypothetical protein
MVALTSLGPFTGQAHHWTGLAPEKPAAARAHSTGAGGSRLPAAGWAAGARFPTSRATACSIADIAAYPWVAKHHGRAARESIRDPPHLAAWYARMGESARGAARHARAARREAGMRIGRDTMKKTWWRHLTFWLALMALGGALAQTVPPDRVLRIVPNADLQTLDPINTTAGVVLLPRPHDLRPAVRAGRGAAAAAADGRRLQRFGRLADLALHAARWARLS